MTIVKPFRGQVWVVALDPTQGHEQAGTRPCLVLSADRFNHGRSGLVVVLPITTADKRIPSHVKVAAGEARLREDSYIKCEEVRCVSIERFKTPWGSISPETQAMVDMWVKTILNLP